MVQNSSGTIVESSYDYIETESSRGPLEKENKEVVQVGGSAIYRKREIFTLEKTHSGKRRRFCQERVRGNFLSRKLRSKGRSI